VELNELVNVIRVPVKKGLLVSGKKSEVVACFSNSSGNFWRVLSKDIRYN